jgi:hypothetical protein
MGIDLSWITVRQIITTSEGCKVYEIENNTLVSIEDTLLHAPSGHAFLVDLNRSQKPILIKESSYWEPIHAQFSHGLVPKGKVSALSETTIVGSIAQASNYYHWLLDELPEILKIKHAVPNITFVFSGKLTQYQIEAHNLMYLETLEIEPWVKINKLVLSQDRNLSGKIEPRSLEELEKFSKQFDSAEQETKIFISRRFSKRSIKQEVNLEHILSKGGFKILHLEKTSLKDQIKFFSNATTIVGAHGAGLANIVFCKEGARVIELFRQDYFNPCYEDIARAKNLAYSKIEYDEIERIISRGGSNELQDLLRILSIQM